MTLNKRRRIPAFTGKGAAPASHVGPANVWSIYCTKKKARLRYLTAAPRFIHCLGLRLRAPAEGKPKGMPQAQSAMAYA